MYSLLLQLISHHYLIVLKVTEIVQFQAPNWTRLNDTLNKLRIGLSNAFAKAHQAESVANKEVERAKAILEKRRREIASKAAEMERQNGARSKTREGWCGITKFFQCGSYL